jgi:hypothetical protein
MEILRLRYARLSAYAPLRMTALFFSMRCIASRVLPPHTGRDYK